MRTTLLALAAALLAACATAPETSTATQQPAPKCSAEEPQTGSNIGRRNGCRPAG
ncbi:MAG: hypothetical protein HY854_22155 [Burkholderiales bacterium]|nr:hypothetical protein [Burkholderiales bacterium]